MSKKKIYETKVYSDLEDLLDDLELECRYKLELLRAVRFEDFKSESIASLTVKEIREINKSLKESYKRLLKIEDIEFLSGLRWTIKEGELWKKLIKKF